MTGYINLADTRILTGDGLDTFVIDEIVESDFLLSKIPFHAAATTTGMGSAYIYNYPRLISTPHRDHPPQRFDVECKNLGGAFTIDRVLARNPAGVSLKFKNLALAARTAFSDAVINGLSEALAGSSTELDANSDDGLAWDWSDPVNDAENIVANLKHLANLVDPKENVYILLNRKTRAKVTTAARKLGYFEQTKDDSGRTISTFNGIPLVDLGSKQDSTTAIVGETELADAANDDYIASDIYVVRFGEDGFHAVSPADGHIVRTYLPDMKTGGNVNKFGEVEMFATFALKATKAAAVARSVKIGVPSTHPLSRCLRF